MVFTSESMKRKVSLEWYQNGIQKQKLQRPSPSVCYTFFSKYLSNRKVWKLLDFWLFSQLSDLVFRKDETTSSSNRKKFGKVTVSYGVYIE